MTARRTDDGKSGGARWPYGADELVSRRDELGSRRDELVSTGSPGGGGGRRGSGHRPTTCCAGIYQTFPALVFSLVVVLCARQRNKLSAAFVSVIAGTVVDMIAKSMIEMISNTPKIF